VARRDGRIVLLGSKAAPYSFGRVVPAMLDRWVEAAIMSFAPATLKHNGVLEEGQEGRPGVLAVPRSNGKLQLVTRAAGFKSCDAPIEASCARRPLSVDVTCTYIVALTLRMCRTSCAQASSRVGRRSTAECRPDRGT
jgi:hypothetical protein